MQHHWFFDRTSLSHLAWSAILISTLLVTPCAQAASSIEVAKIAKSVTVNIESADSPGSGVIIQKNNNTYTIITAAHVLRDPKSAFKIVTSDGNTYRKTAVKPCAFRPGISGVRVDDSA